MKLLTDAAKTNPRLRYNLNIHETSVDPVQKFFNAICRNSYIRPHKHGEKNGDELIVAIDGSFGLIIFDDHGQITSVHIGAAKSTSSYGLRAVVVKPNVWHTVISLSETCTILEVKQGPYCETDAKEFATWSPEANSKSVRRYLSQLYSRLESFKD